jgi:hypothetical protein
MVCPLGVRLPWCFEVMFRCMPGIRSLAASIGREWKHAAILDTCPRGQDRPMRCSVSAEDDPGIPAAVVTQVSVLA